MKVTSFYSEGELSPIRVTGIEETVLEVKKLFFKEHEEEDIIRHAIYTASNDASIVDELRLDFDRIFTDKQLRKKVWFGSFNWKKLSIDHFKVPIETILRIKNEQRYLNASFKGYKLLVKRKFFFGPVKEYYLLAKLSNDMYYLVNKDSF